MALPSPRRLDFETDENPTGATRLDPAPALSSAAPLARFEFESGKGNDGTKILLVEWEDDLEGHDPSNDGDWEVSWEGKKTTVLSARDGAEGKLHRLYFLLPPGASIPPMVKIAQAGGRTMQANPLPAIFPAELGLTSRTAGKKGVLHTIYAKQRLSVLQKEIESEMKTNGEGVGLEMAMQEKQWIEDNFGVVQKSVSDLPHSTSPSSPKTPGSGRLSGKLKGLKLGTSASVLSAAPSEYESMTDRSESAHPLSPDVGDVAVSSISLFPGGSSRSQHPGGGAITHIPPNNFVVKCGNSQNTSRINSIDAVAGGQAPQKDDNETEDGLFAVKMSPRSPEMTKSPFSFSTNDTVPWLNDQK